jgi:hypothetical protein
MSKFEKRLIVAALVFVAIYLGAAAVTIHTRITEGDTIERLESPDLSPAEGQLLIAELDCGTFPSVYDTFHPCHLFYPRTQTTGQEIARNGKGRRDRGGCRTGN